MALSDGMLGSGATFLAIRQKLRPQFLKNFWEHLWSQRGYSRDYFKPDIRSLGPLVSILQTVSLFFLPAITSCSGVFLTWQFALWCWCLFLIHFSEQRYIPNLEAEKLRQRLYSGTWDSLLFIRSQVVYLTNLAANLSKTYQNPTADHIYSAIQQFSVEAEDHHR